MGLYITKKKKKGFKKFILGRTVRGNFHRDVYRISYCPTIVVLGIPIKEKEKVMNEEGQEDMPQALNAAEEAGIHEAVEEFSEDVSSE